MSKNMLFNLLVFEFLTQYFVEILITEYLDNLYVFIGIAMVFTKEGAVSIKNTFL